MDDPTGTINRTTGNVTLKSATLTFFEKNIEESALYHGINTDERLAATVGHEIEHTTDENIRLNLDGSARVEDEPIKKADEIIKEYQNRKPVAAPNSSEIFRFEKELEDPRRIFHGGGW